MLWRWRMESDVGRNKRKQRGRWHVLWPQRRRMRRIPKQWCDDAYRSFHANPSITSLVHMKSKYTFCSFLLIIYTMNKSIRCDVHCVLLKQWRVLIVTRMGSCLDYMWTRIITSSPVGKQTHSQTEQSYCIAGTASNQAQGKPSSSIWQCRDFSKMAAI